MQGDEQERGELVVVFVCAAHLNQLTVDQFDRQVLRQNRQVDHAMIVGDGEPSVLDGRRRVPTVARW